MAATDLCSLADVRSALQKPASDTAQDAEIQSEITQVSALIMAHCEREFAPATSSATRRFQVDSLLVSLAPYDLRSASSVTLHPENSNPTVLAAGTDYVLKPVPASLGVYERLQLSSYIASLGNSETARRFGYAYLDVAGAWGFASVPEQVKRACIATVALWMRREVQAFSATFSIDQQRLERPEALPSQVAKMLSPFRRSQFF